MLLKAPGGLAVSGPCSLGVCSNIGDTKLAVDVTLAADVEHALEFWVFNLEIDDEVDAIPRKGVLQEVLQHIGATCSGGSAGR